MPLKIVPEDTHVPFVKFRNASAAFSLAAVIGSIVALLTIGLNLGVDFQGGVTIEVGPPETSVFEEADLSNVRSAVGELGLGNVQVKTIGGVAGAQDGISVTVPLQDAEQGDTAADGVDREAEQRQAEVAAQIKESLYDVLGADISIRKQDVVGPAVSGELIQAGVTAMVVAIGLMLAYIWFRFEWQFSLGAIVALTHDVIITMGVFAITQLDFTMAIIAALLTIVGYSMNDTVVVYDRIRENLRKFKKMPLGEIIDTSINQTLARTVMTSVTTLIALIALFLFGGEVLRGFSFALIFGVVIGTYSSVFVASPILMRTGVKRDWTEGQVAIKDAPAQP